MSEPLTTKQLEEWRRLTEMAEARNVMVAVADLGRRADADFYVTCAREAMPALLAEVDRLTTNLNAAVDPVPTWVDRALTAEARLTALLPLARAAATLLHAEVYVEKVRRGPHDGDVMDRAVRGRWDAWREFSDVFAALDPALRAELEAE